MLGAIPGTDDPRPPSDRFERFPVSRGPRPLALMVAFVTLAVVLPACSAAPVQPLAPGGIPDPPAVGTGVGQTNAPLYLVSGLSGEPFPGQPIEWFDNRGAAISATPVADFDDDRPSRLPFVEGALQSQSFLSRPGDERDKLAWRMWGDAYDLVGRGAWLTNVTPGSMLYGERDAVQAAGGVYSLGIAYLGNDDPEVVAVYFTTINMSPETGDFSFSTPSG